MTVCNVAYRVRILHTWPGDIYAQVNNSQHSLGSGYTIWDRLGGSDDGGYDDDAENDDDIYPNNGDGVWDYAADGDCIIDISGLGELLPNYGMTSGATREDGDVYPVGSGDGAVDISDLGEVLAQYDDNCN